MAERLPVEVIARLVTTADDREEVLHQYVVSIRTPDGKRKEVRSTPGLKEHRVIEFLRNVDRFTLRLTAKNFARHRKSFFLAAAEGYELLEDNMCDCTAEMLVRQFMGTLEDLIDFEYQNFSGQNRWSIPIQPTGPVSNHVVIKYTSPQEVLERTSIPTHDPLYSYNRQGERIDSQTRGLRAVQQRYIFGGPVADVNCYPETSTTSRDRREKLSNFTFIIPVSDRLFREIRVHNSRVFPRNQPIEVYRDYVLQEINQRFVDEPDLTSEWSAIEVNLRDDVVLAFYSMFKLGPQSVKYFEDKNFFSSAEWTRPKELHHFAKYFMGVLQQTDAEVDSSYRLLSAPYPLAEETVYRTEIVTQQRAEEDNALLRGCPLMTTQETEQANSNLSPSERLVYHDGDLMTEREFHENEQRARDLFAPIRISHQHLNCGMRKGCCKENVVPTMPKESTPSLANGQLDNIDAWTELGTNSTQEDSSSIASSEFVVVPRNETNENGGSEQNTDEEESIAQRSQEEIEAEERRRENKRRCRRNRYERVRQENRAQKRPATSQQQEKENGTSDTEVSLQRLNLQSDDHEEPTASLTLPPVPPVNAINVPRCLDFRRIALYHEMHIFLQTKVSCFEEHPDKAEQFMNRYMTFNIVYRTHYEVCTLFWFLKNATKPVLKLCEKFFVHKARSMVNPQSADYEFLAEMSINSWAAEKCSELLTDIDVEHMRQDVMVDGLGFIDSKCEALYDDHPFLSSYRVICDKLIMQELEQRVFYNVVTRMFP